MKIIFIGNPIAGGNAVKKIEKAVKIIKGRGFDVQLMLTDKRGDAELFAKQISSEFGVRSSELRSEKNSKLNIQNSKFLVIAAGGDGTYNEVANGLVYSNVPMAILPLGTTSVLARELNFPSNLEKVLDISLNGKTHIINLGRITLADRIPIITRYFLSMAGIGFDGETVFNVSEKIKRYSGKGAYILSGLKSLLKYDPGQITIKSQELSLAGYTAIVGKVSCYGGNFKITPDARLTDPYFYIFVTHRKGKSDLLRYISGILKGQHLKIKDTSYLKMSALEIEGDAHIQIDGDYLGKTPAKIEIVPDALGLVY